ncbi:hypothetical protein LEMLEM_LOCUS19885, partial [Lemmus lemmus]
MDIAAYRGWTLLHQISSRQPPVSIHKDQLDLDHPSTEVPFAGRKLETWVLSAGHCHLPDKGSAWLILHIKSEAV